VTAEAWPRTDLELERLLSRPSGTLSSIPNGGDWSLAL